MTLIKLQRKKNISRRRLESSAEDKQQRRPTNSRAEGNQEPTRGEGQNGMERHGGNRYPRSENHGFGGRRPNGGHSDRRRGAQKQHSKEQREGRYEPENVIEELDEMPEDLKDSQFVLPGDVVGTAEEYMAGSGTYEHSGTIYASVTGRPYYDKKHRYVKVFPDVSFPPTLKVGNVVIGRITDIKESMAIVEIICLDDMKERAIPSVPQAVIHVSNIKDAYVRDLGDEFGVGDIIKAKIIDIKNMRLSTEGPNLGVMKALCKVCRTPLQIEDGKLRCPTCNRIETRKLSKEYSMGML